ncbi:ROK family transcriptional regulator [Quadrisphaera sp. DSM 44207]|uniref:ROK family transcriptional regulator n=1 Tax=Quadrisphaera sp. DSM 44207 TaxID=1881057 RepID=UPI00088ABC09|nr:ROK family transcriptional regulator [Quadrisphaera sp. DSM 44207]SDQ05158.1 Sugar kinase of the NBD/HSP70 family, may contain an N-terminal HTH domain [Quadrisphaera sp. DSM 44207]
MTTAWAERPQSSRAVAVEVLRHGPLSRVELARRLALSQGTLTRLTRPLLDEGLLVEAPDAARAGAESPEEPRLGRPAQPLAIAADAHHFVGVKLTGSSAHAVLTDLGADVLAGAVAPLPSTEPAAVVDAVAALVGELVGGGRRPTALGVSVGGHAADHRRVTSAPFLHWSDVSLAELLEDRTGLPTTVENDVLALTEAEHWFGAARGCTRFALVTIGAGVGYGHVVHDRLVSSPDAGFGLVGHWPLEVPSSPCPRGHRGCAASVLTIPAITEAASAAVGRPLAFDEVVDLALAGDPGAGRVVADAARGTGRLLAAVANLTMPEKIVLTGDGVRLALELAPQVRAGLDADRDPRAAPVALDVQDFDFAEWARGAAVVALQRFVRGRPAPR